MRSSKKEWKKVDKELLLLKQGEITTQNKRKQIYRLRLVQWGEYQAVLQKRLYLFSKEDMDYRPGRLMALNLEDMRIVFQNQHKIEEIMKMVLNSIERESYKNNIEKKDKKDK